MRLPAGLLGPLLVGWFGLSFFYLTAFAINPPVIHAPTSAITPAVTPGARPSTANIAVPKSQAVIDVTNPPLQRQR